MEEEKTLKTEDEKKETKTEDITLARLNWIYKNRLIFNTTAELEEFWNVKFGNNVIERAFPKPEERRRAYLDLAEKVSDLTFNAIDLNDLMQSVKIASNYYKNKFARRDIESKEAFVKSLIKNILYPKSWSNIKRKSKEEELMKDPIKEDLLTTSVLILFLLKIVGIDRIQEKVDITEEFDRTINMIESAIKIGDEEEEEDNEEEDKELTPEDAAKEHQIMEDYPLIGEARALESTKKTRLKLIYYIQEILVGAKKLSNPKHSFDAAKNYLNHLANLDIAGYWGLRTADNTKDFFQIQPTNIPGLYFFTKYTVRGSSSKDYQSSDEPFCVVKERYEVAISPLVDSDSSEVRNEEYQFYFIKPHIYLDYIKGRSIKTENHAFYYTRMDDSKEIETIKLHMNTEKWAHQFKESLRNPWRRSLELYKSSNEQVVARHEKDIKEAINRGVCVDKFEKFQYEIPLTLYNITRAITKDYLFLRTENEDEYFKIPKKIHRSLSNYGFGETTYIIKIQGKMYIGFPTSSLYIRISPSSLKKWGIERVKSIVE